MFVVSSLYYSDDTAEAEESSLELNKPSVFFTILPTAKGNLGNRRLQQFFMRKIDVDSIFSGLMF